jgi:predicted DCC family thiol-disulfide oxidoreductase YuxK
MTRPGTILYDADCSLCTATAAWLARRVSPDRLAVTPLGEAGADPVIGALVRGRDLAAALHFVGSDDRVVTGSRAVLGALRLVPRWGALARLMDHRAGHAILEPVYRQIAAHRRRIGQALGLPPTCPIPTPAERPASG